MVTRIRQLLDNKQLTPTQFADLIGVGRPVMSHILSERNKPSLDVVQRIISAFPEVSLPWLLSGIGDILAEATAPAPATSPAIEEPPLEAVLALSAPAEAPMIASSAVIPAVEQAPVALASTIEVPLGAVPAAPSPPEWLATLAQAAAAPPTLVASKPFRASRFVPATPPAAASPTGVPPMPAAANGRLPVTAAFPAPAAALPSLAAEAPAASPAPAPAGSEGPVEAALLPFLGEPGKAIRRIVIFYRDGSFADYQPEA